MSSAIHCRSLCAPRRVLWAAWAPFRVVAVSGLERCPVITVLRVSKYVVDDDEDDDDGDDDDSDVDYTTNTKEYYYDYQDQ